MKSKITESFSLKHTQHSNDVQNYFVFDVISHTLHKSKAIRKAESE